MDVQCLSKNLSESKEQATVRICLGRRRGNALNVSRAQNTNGIEIGTYVTAVAVDRETMRFTDI